MEFNRTGLERIRNWRSAINVRKSTNGGNKVRETNFVATRFMLKTVKMSQQDPFTASTSTATSLTTTRISRTFSPVSQESCVSRYRFKNKHKLVPNAKNAFLNEHKYHAPTIQNAEGKKGRNNIVLQHTRPLCKYICMNDALTLDVVGMGTQPCRPRRLQTFHLELFTDPDLGAALPAALSSAEHEKRLPNPEEPHSATTP
ncbi:hypothetical protein WN51_01260 [Melipona quadrifasciata]|uniref:Uncharacterized protein n=1 Tax=Melipona quadrifasciata TaxID=166423 RepID=A0A0M8ZWS7_9HYME|nr:hypothetical protein WN51_01260 [Melipona quadrifasciata]